MRTMSKLPHFPHNVHILIHCLILVMIDRNREYGKDKSKEEIIGSEI